jgi:hypothetical protein
VIKIINGTYGVNRLNSQSAPFALSAKEEERLVNLGVAEYISAAPAEAEKPELPAQPKTKATKSKKAAKK